jgi:predicted alpha/beta hydrolase family esterase
MKFVILHGTSADHTSNWFPWLKFHLKSLGHEVWVPDLPDTDTPDAFNWTEYLIGQAYDYNDSVIIGHSAGAVEVNALLQKLPDDVKLRAAVMAGVFRGDLGWESLKNMDVEFDYKKIKTKAGKFIVVHSDNDPHCPLEGAQWIADQLDAEFILMPNMGHFSLERDPKFSQFPELLEVIKEKILK